MNQDMAKKLDKGEKPMSFRQAIWLALHTPHLTHKEIDRMRREEKLKKQEAKNRDMT